ncbi:MAG: cytochrome c [Aureliella sp.]
MTLSLRPLFALVALTFSVFLASGVSAVAQDDQTPGLAVEGELVDFLRDVKPILDAKCLACHGPDDAKNDFRVDDHDAMLDYLEPGDIESSSLWADYLVTDDEDMRMPPVGGDAPQLTGAELATIKLWIEEGAQWAEGDVTAEEQSAEPVAELSDAEKWWRLQGIFHPASVHFPIALLVVSTGFVVLSFLNRESFEPVAFHCLWIGALGAVASCVMGWAYADSQGYGSFSFDLQNSSIDRHRWLGIGVAVVSLILIPMARSVRRTGDTGMRLMWMFGSLIALGAVSITGYQGGELTYGEDHYMEEYNRLFPSEVVDQQDEAEVVDEEMSEGATDGLASEALPEASDEPDDESSSDEAAGKGEAAAEADDEATADGDVESGSTEVASESAGSDGEGGSSEEGATTEEDN